MRFGSNPGFQAIILAELCAPKPFYFSGFMCALPGYHQAVHISLALETFESLW